MDLLRFQSLRGAVKDRISGDEQSMDPYSWGKKPESENP